ncbi:hypothetical protein [Agromyces allii]|uniref:Uncharacterized protein n=1 Tax=Agromyces allii TaxID=393607 RepID=A0ABP5C819_9MICO|nr:hypothetical protein [Agromyces allii]
MSLLRWIPTFLAFPLGGLLAMLVVGPVSDPLTAIAAGAIAGAVLGAAQWLALGRAVDWRWLVATSVAFGVGSAAAVALFGPPVTPVAAALTGLVTGLVVGAAQAAVVGARRGGDAGVRAGRLRVGLVWAAVVALAWAAAWIITSFVIIDLDRGHVVFGSSGAVVATVVTGLVLRRILGPRPKQRDVQRREAQEPAGAAQASRPSPSPSVEPATTEA